MEEILNQLFLTPRNLIIVGMAWSLVLLLGKILPTSKIYKEHIAPAILLIVCSVAVWVPGLRPGLSEGQKELAKGTGISGEEIGWRIALGIILAVGSYILPVFIMWMARKYFPESIVKQLNKIL